MLGRRISRCTYAQSGIGRDADGGAAGCLNSASSNARSSMPSGNGHVIPAIRARSR
jgi:hypothetical protein